jgi:hypothetical protein
MLIAYLQDFGYIWERHVPHICPQSKYVQEVRANSLWDDEYHGYRHNPVVSTPVASENRQSSDDS